MDDSARLAEIKERLKFTNGYSFTQLRADAEWMAAQLDKRDVAIANLRMMLDPFAKAADDLADETKNRSEIWELPAAMNITAGDLRRAREIVHNNTEANAHPRFLEVQWLYEALVLVTGTLIDYAPHEQRVIQEAQLAIARAEAKEGWLPIESAPKDAVNLIDVWQAFTLNSAFIRGQRVADVIYGDVGWCSDADGSPLEWDDEHGQVARVTYWRPLPPPPTDSKEPPK